MGDAEIDTVRVMPRDLPRTNFSLNFSKKKKGLVLSYFISRTSTKLLQLTRVFFFSVWGVQQKVDSTCKLEDYDEGTQALVYEAL